jgi:tetratricopeptide (TPR) repeat protein
MSQYGVTFAQKLLQHGDYAEAVAAADQHAQQEPGSPEPFHDRARALSALARYEEAVADYGRAIELDKEAQILEGGDVDDGLFSTVVAWGQSLEGQGEAAQLAALARYRELLPSGSHQKDADDWALRFRGLLKTTFVKPRD